MPEERAISDLVVDYLLYAPLGAAVVAAEELPRLAELGRERFGRQINAAELIGKFAISEARRRFVAQGTGPPGGPASSSERPRHPTRSVAPLRSATAAPETPQRPLAPRSGGAGSAGRSRPARAKGAGGGSVLQNDAHELAIPAYDTLAASQVVERLASLNPLELEAVRKHESATRRRRTVLHRIAQLNAERDGTTA